jgi:hypothetical protein
MNLLNIYMLTMKLLKSEKASAAEKLGKREKPELYWG